MKRRVARLLENGQSPERILAVTFTRNAAASLVDDLHALGIPGCEEIWAGTLHAYCFSLLSQKAVFDYLGRLAHPIVTFQKSGVLQFEGHAMLEDLTIDKEFGPKRDCTKRIRAFEAAWARLQSDEPGWPQDDVDRAFQAELVNWLTFHKAILIGELIPEALRYLRNNPACEARNSFDHVIVDEYQDLNRAEQELIRLLAGDRAVAIVGDVDQSIYSFRHANPEGIEGYHEDNPGTHDEVLDECRRCPLGVVSIADHLIRHNHPSGGSRLRPKAGNPQGEVHIIQWDSLEQEAEGLAEYTQTLVGQGVAPGEILILTPRRQLGYSIRDQIRQLDIPVHSFYHEEALEDDCAQRAFAILSLLVDLDDRVALRWWLGHDSPSARKNAYTLLRAHCEQTGVSPRQALDQCLAGKLALNTALTNSYKALQEILNGLRPLPLEKLIDTLFPAGDDSFAVLREAALIDLPGLETPDGLLDCIRSNATQPAVPEAADYVRVMSLHKSKGLTSKVTKSRRVSRV